MTWVFFTEGVESESIPAPWEGILRGLLSTKQNKAGVTKPRDYDHLIRNSESQYNLFFNNELGMFRSQETFLLFGISALRLHRSTHRAPGALFLPSGHHSHQLHKGE